MKLTVGCVQINATSDFDRNLKKSIVLAHTAFHKGAQLIAFPEAFLHRGRPSSYKKVAEETDRVIHKFQHIACLSRTGILLGSILEKSAQRNRFYNTSLFISDHGRIAARYRKIHLFDVETPGRLSVRESKYILPGQSTAVMGWNGIKFGFSICYDLRFPEQFRRLVKQGAEVIFVPSNFLSETGKAHWHVLLRARAIENQVYIVAPAQVGLHLGLKHKAFGHSLIVDPWGKILAEGSGQREEAIIAEINIDYLKDLRKKFPVLMHSH